MMRRWVTTTTTQKRPLLRASSLLLDGRRCSSDLGMAPRCGYLRRGGTHQRGHFSTQPPPATSASDNQQQRRHHELYPHMFTPLDLGPSVPPLTNRVIMGSMHCGLEGHSIPSFLSYFLRPSNERPTTPYDHTDELAAYYAERAAHSTSLIVTGGISPNRTGALTPFGSKLTTSAEVAHHSRVTAAVAEANPDTRMILQILHAGRYAHHPFLVAPSPIKSAINPFKPRELSSSEIQSTVADYAKCAQLAHEAGYAGVELMGSEGYLIHQFLCPRTNARSDEYGGSYKNRMRFPLEIVRSIRAKLPESFIVMFRLSMLDLVERGSTWDEIVALAKELEMAGVTVLNTGIGWHESRVPTIATSVPNGAYTWVTRHMKRHVDVPLCTTNRINTPEQVEAVLRGGDADLVSMARPFLADSAFMQKSWEGRAEEINTCIGCNQACLDHVFVGRRASCLVNPRACHELQLPRVETVSKTARKQRVAVIGSGPGGLAACLTFAQLGHEVTVYDKSTEIGGQFNMAKRIPGKSDFYETVRYYDVMLDKHGVARKLGTDIGSLDDLNGGNYDRIVVSTGVLPRTPPIPNIDHPKVLSYVDVLRGNATVGETVAIIGAGGIGFDVAEFLLYGTYDGNEEIRAREDKAPEVDHFMEEWGVDKSRWGGGSTTAAESRGGLLSPEEREKLKRPPKRNIILMQRKTTKLGATLGKTTGWIHRASLQHGEVEMVPGCRYEKIDDEGNLHVTVGGEDGLKRVLEVDNVIVCAGQEKNDRLKAVLDDEVSAGASGTAATEEEEEPLRRTPQVYVIGGAYEAAELDAKRAIDMGTRLAYAVHLHPDDDAKVQQLVYGEREIEEEERMINLFAKLAGKK